MLHAHSPGLSPCGIALWMLCGLTAPAWGATDSADAPQDNTVSHNTQQLFDFDIPAQSLAGALNRYAEVSGQSTVFSSEMVSGRTSSPLQGRFASGQALRRLLEGTGLTAEKHNSTFGEIYLLKDDGKPDAAGSGIDALFSQGGYPGLIQTRIWQALCTDAFTAPGSYRILFRFRVDTTGRIANVRLLSSTGNRRRDAALLTSLQRVQIELPPPAAVVQQPLTMLLSPHGPDGAHNGPRCDREGR